ARAARAARARAAAPREARGRVRGGAAVSLRRTSLALAAVALAGCTIPGEAPQGPFPEPGAKWERVRWDAVETVLEARETAEGRLDAGSLTWRYRESGWHAIGAGRVVLVAVDAGSRLRIDAREAAPGLAARVRV